MSRHKQSRFLKYTDDNFLTQVMTESMRDALLDMILTNKAEMIKDVKVRHSLGAP